MEAPPSVPTSTAALGQRRPQVNFTASAVNVHDLDLSLDRLLIKRPAATFFLRVEGDVMKGAGIFPKAILIVDRSLRVEPGRIVVACLDGELVVRRLSSINGQLHLTSDDASQPPCPIGGDLDAVVWGVVAYAINDLR